MLVCAGHKLEKRLRHDEMIPNETDMSLQYIYPVAFFLSAFSRADNVRRLYKPECFFYGKIPRIVYNKNLYENRCMKNFSSKIRPVILGNFNAIRKRGQDVN